jgi:hypothetical protein
MSVIEIRDKSLLKQIQNKIKNDWVEFNQLSIGSKAKAADTLKIKGVQNVIGLILKRSRAVTVIFSLLRTPPF